MYFRPFHFSDCFLTMQHSLYLCGFNIFYFYFFTLPSLLPKTPSPSYLLHFCTNIHVIPTYFPSLLPYPKSLQWLVGLLTLHITPQGNLAPFLHYQDYQRTNLVLIVSEFMQKNSEFSKKIVSIILVSVVISYIKLIPYPIFLIMYFLNTPYLVGSYPGSIRQSSVLTFSVSMDIILVVINQMYSSKNILFF